MNFIREFDEWMFDRIFQPLTDSVQRLIGKDCFFLAYCVSVLMAFLGVWLCFVEPRPPGGRSQLWLCAIFFVVTSMHATQAKLLYQRISDRESDVRYVNPARYGDQYVFTRIMVLALWGGIFVPLDALALLLEHPYFLYRSIELAIDVLFIVFFYLCACTPLPKGPSKLGEWFASLRAGLQRLFVPSMQPAPANS